ncbi:hypothetical protein [Streptomyces bullii]|uniref:Secreted protein n=1 Tax=Streptomyces bullii TaxID=349910 RepID=A0ABW0UKE6_9ACTN
MPAFSARRIATSALCATFLLGITAPAAVAADTARDRTRESAPASDAATLQSQVQQLGYIGAVVPPVTTLMDAVLKAQNHRLPATEATRLGDAARIAIARVAASPMTPGATTPATPTTPGTTTPATPGTTLPAPLPAVPSTPTTSTNPASVPPPAGSASRHDASVRADTLIEALAELQESVDALVVAAQSGDVAGAIAAVTDVANKLAAVVAAILGGTGLPVPPIPGLPVDTPS